MNHPLVLVPDHVGGQPPPYLPELSKAGRVVLVDYERTDRLVKYAENAWLIDIQMMNVSKALHLQTAIGRSGSAPRLLVVPSKDRWNMVQARALGATAVVPRPVNVGSVLRYVAPGQARAPVAKTAAARHHRTPLPVMPARIEPAAEPEAVPDVEGAKGNKDAVLSCIGSATAALDHVFWACVADEPIDEGMIRAAAEEVSPLIGEAGLEIWLDLVRNHHVGTYQHILLTMGVAVSFGRRFGLGDAAISRLALGGLLHDIGKCWIPEEILAKPGKLTEEEYALVRKHSLEGRQAFEKSGIRLDDDVLDIIHHHHEYLDGSGYPDGLDGSAIRPLTRVMTVCDVFAALVERRSYRPPLAPRNALSILDAMAKSGRIDGTIVGQLSDIVRDGLNWR